MKTISTRRALCAALLGSIVMALPAAAQQNYPNRPVRLISPYPPGGGTSVLARLIGERLSESWGQQVIVENRGGGNSTIGTEAVARASPDGYTILMSSTAHVLVPQTMTTSYDPIKDFTPVATLAGTEFVLVVHPSVPANTIAELIALAKAKPGKLNYASGGGGSTNHMAGAYFNLAAGVNMVHIPYKGGGPALTDLIGGQVETSFLATPVAIPHIKSGRLRVLGVTGTTRSTALPQVPTIAEAGVPGYNVLLWYGIFAPAGTPSALVDRIATPIAAILATPESKKTLADQGLEPMIMDAAKFSTMVKDEMVKWGKVIKAADIKL